MTRLAASPVATHRMTDSTMPQLGVALDPQQMRIHFQQLLFGGEPKRCTTPNGHALPPRGTTLLGTTPQSATHAVGNCKVMRVKYRAGEKCVVSYCLSIYDRVTGEAVEAWFSARIFPVGTAESRYYKAMRSPQHQPRFGCAVMFLPALDMVIWAFPNDRKISGIPALLAAASGADQSLATLIEHSWMQDIPVHGHTYSLIHYVPEQTCTVRVQLALSTPETNPNTVTLFGKAYYNEDGAETYRLMQQLWHSPVCRNDLLRIARPVAYDAQNRILWQSGLPGATLLTYELGTSRFDLLFVATARTVARLHSTALFCKRIATQQEWLALFLPRAMLTTTLCPHLGPAVERLVKLLEKYLPDVVHQPTATLHGDLHLQNFLVDETVAAGVHVALIDLDNLATGSPWRDLGSLFAGLYYRGLIDGLPQARLQATVDQFLAVYETHVPWPMDRAAIDWYTAAALLNERVYRTIARMKEGRLTLVDDLIRIATELLAGA